MQTSELWATIWVWLIRLGRVYCIYAAPCAHLQEQGNRRQQSSPLVPLRGALDKTSSLILLHRPHYVQTWRHPQNRKYTTYCTVVGEDRSTAIGNMRRKFRQVRTNVTHARWHDDGDTLGLRCASRQTYRHTDRQNTDTLIAILRTATGAEVMIEWIKHRKTTM